MVLCEISSEQLMCRVCESNHVAARREVLGCAIASSSGRFEVGGVGGMRNPVKGLNIC